MADPQDEIEQAVSKRRRVMSVLAIFLFLTLGGVVTASERILLDGGRLVDQIRAGAFFAMSLMFLIYLLTGGRASRRLPAIEDELVRANRARALQLGYVLLMLALLALYVASLLTRADLTGALPLLIAYGIAMPALRFVFLERKGG